MYSKISFIALLSFAACTKFRDVPFKPAPYVKPPTGDSLGWGSLVINEYTPKGNLDTNEYGDYVKWFEIYNPGNKAITLDTNFSFSDTFPQPYKFKIRNMYPAPVVQPKAFLVFWCDYRDTMPTPRQVHTNFNISSKGEHLGIFYTYPGQAALALDSFSFQPSSASGVSIGRYPDGQGPVDKTLLQRTPGAPNIF